MALWCFVYFSKGFVHFSPSFVPIPMGFVHFLDSFVQKSGGFVQLDNIWKSNSKIRPNLTS